MADQPGPPPDAAESNDIDTGEPVTQLAELRATPVRGFFEGIRRRIQRRYLLADAAEFSWTGVSFIVLEFVKMVLQLFQPTGRSEGDQ